MNKISGINYYPSDRGYRLALLSIFSLALVLRLIYFNQSSDNPLLYMPILDEEYYVNMGMNIANGYWLGEDRAFFMDPLYGYLLGIIFRVFGDNLTTIRLLQIILDSLNVVVIYAIGNRIWNRNAGLVSALFYAIYKVAFFYTLLVLKTTLTIFLMLLFLLLLQKISNGKKGRYWYLLGLLAALMAYLRGNLILVVPLVIFFYCLSKKYNWRVIFKNSVIFLGGLATILSIGILRNHYVCGEFIALNTQTGRLLYSSNNPENLTGRYNVPNFSRPNPEHSESDFHREAELRVGRTLNAKEVSRYWTRETLGFILGNPKTIPLLLYNKLKGTIGNCESPNIHSFYMSSQFSSLAGFPLPNFAFVMAFGLPGLLIGIIKRREVIWLCIPILTILMTVTIFYTSSRLRMPMVPFLLLGTGICFSVIMDWIRQKRLKNITVLLAVIIFLGVTSLSVPCPDKSGTEEFYLARAYWKQDDLTQARTIALRGAEMFPLQSRFQVLLGMISFSDDLPEQAMQYYLKALEVEPYNADAYHNLGLVCLAVGKTEEAIQHISKAVAIEPVPEHIFSLARSYEAKADMLQAINYYNRCLDVTKPFSIIQKKTLDRLKSLKKVD